MPSPKDFSWRRWGQVSSKVLEIEAKFRVPDAVTFRRLLALSGLDDYLFGPVEVAETVDRYYDTADMALLRGGYACRLRQERGRIIATVKGLGEAEGSLHQRQELETLLQEMCEPRDWPEGAAKTLVLSLIGDRPLSLLFELRQVRHHREVREGARIVGWLSLDQVRLADADRSLSWWELEIELSGQGAISDLRSLEDALVKRFGLSPEPRSKFARALQWHRSPGASTGWLEAIHI